MTISIAGALVFLVLLLAGGLAGDAIVIGLFASLAFGSTAIASLPALGNSSPQIWTVFALLLIAKTAAQRNFITGLQSTLQRDPGARVACLLALYALASAIVLPRFFQGDVSMFVPTEGSIAETSLQPTGGNITQTAYLLGGTAAFLCIVILLADRAYLKTVRNGLFAFVIANVLLGAIDLAGKLAGFGDWLEPIRTANYAMLTDVEVEGFSRIVGGHPEASAFAIYSLACLAFTFTYWRHTGSATSLILTIVLFLFLLFSTSSTAYVGLAILSVLATVSIGAAFLTEGVKPRELFLFIVLLAASTSAVGLYLHNEHMFDPLKDLIRTMVFEKVGSDSEQERSYWNRVGLETFLNTYGIGIGMGSSRSSSWLISVISQLGAIGALLFAALAAAIFKGAGAIRVSGKDASYALIVSARAMAVGWLVGISVSGGSADPGLLFFLPLGVILGCRPHLQGRRSVMPIGIVSYRTASRMERRLAS
jgi:hypothetical protein